LNFGRRGHGPSGFLHGLSHGDAHHCCFGRVDLGEGCGANQGLATDHDDLNVDGIGVRDLNPYRLIIAWLSGELLDTKMTMRKCILKEIRNTEEVGESYSLHATIEKVALLSLQVVRDQTSDSPVMNDCTIPMLM
jgi:hypothetical protein